MENFDKHLVRSIWVQDSCLNSQLVEEELVELGVSVGEVSIQHYRDEHLQYVFRSPLPREVTPEEAALWLMAYEATFRELGDMSNSES